MKEKDYYGAIKGFCLKWNLPEVWNSDRITGANLIYEVIKVINAMIVEQKAMKEMIEEFLLMFNEDLSDTVKDQLTVWLNDGTLGNIINETLFNAKLDKTVFDGFKLNYNQKVLDIELEIQNSKVFTETEILELDDKKLNKKTPTFTFIFDSNFEDHTTSIADIFKGRKLQCGFAIALQEMKAVRQDPERSTFINPYLKLKNRYGFSLIPISLRHGVLGSPNEMERAYNEIVGAKNAWQDLGIEVAGWVSPSSRIHPDYSSMLDIYSYAFNVYEGSVDRNKKQYFTPNDDTHKLSRIHLGNALDDLKYVIDQTIDNNGFLCFYAHTSLVSPSKDFELSKITAVLDYIGSRGVVKSPDQAIAQYFGSKGYITSKQKPNKNFIDLSKAQPNASNAFDHLYIEPEFSVVGNTLELNIEGSVVVGKNYRIIYNLPQNVLSPLDFTSQIYASVKSYDNVVTNTRANINISTIYPDNQRDVVTSSLWREPNTYESISYPSTDTVFTSSTPFKVQIDVTFTGGRVGAKFTLKDLFVGITGN